MRLIKESFFSAASRSYIVPIVIDDTAFYFCIGRGLCPSSVYDNEGNFNFNVVIVVVGNIDDDGFDGMEVIVVHFDENLDFSSRFGASNPDY